MIKNKLKNAKGISMISLTITIIVLIILADVTIYNAKDGLKIQKLKSMQSDITNLSDKISSYYAEKGTIPAKVKYTNVGNISVISDVVDTGDFYVIDLKALDNLTLNYGEDYEKITSDMGQVQVDSLTDLYIINEVSHNIFYVAGIEVKGEKYYTNYSVEDVEQKAVDLRYIENVKIPKGYTYVEGTKATGIKIKNNENSSEYVWVVQTDEIEAVPEDITVDDKWAFLESVNSYQGYYKSISDDTVIYLSDEWTPVYDKSGSYKDKNGNTVNVPSGFQISMTPGKNTVDDGLVAKDTNNNEWVWIEVPKSLYKTATSNTDYEKIEADLIDYAKTYRQGSATQSYDWKDEWYDYYGTTYDGTNNYSPVNYIYTLEDFDNTKAYYGALYTDNTGTTEATSYEYGKKYYAKITDKLTDASGCGLTYSDYVTAYQKMLSSVYSDGGFWIGRYEAGIEGTTGKIVEGDTSITDLARTSSSSRIDSSSPKAISQKDAIPYNYVYCSEAQSLASSMSPDNTKTSSLMFGIQWDLVCKFLEVKSNLTIADINSDSGSWGNYRDKVLIINSINAKQLKSGVWSSIVDKKEENSQILLSTGASNATSKMNIYNFAGNEYEWTLEHATTYRDSPCAHRGGNYGSLASESAASIRNCLNTNVSNSTYLSFRATLY